MFGSFRVVLVCAVRPIVVDDAPALRGSCPSMEIDLIAAVVLSLVFSFVLKWTVCAHWMCCGIQVRQSDFAPL